jgi:predicted transposase/invertase (TIGR01784 family)
MENFIQPPPFQEASPYPENIRVRARENAAQGKRLSLLQDIIFKDVFAADTEDSRNALRRLLSVCIHREVSGVRVINSEVTPKHLAGKTVRFDIHATFNDGETADLEMQMGLGHDDQQARSTYYAAAMLSGQSKRGGFYEDIKRIYQILFIKGVLFSSSTLFPRRYHLAEDTEHDRLTDLIEVLIYELPKLKEKVQRLLTGEEQVKNLSMEEIWCIYMMYQQDKNKQELMRELIREDEGLMSTERVLDKVSQDYEEWAKALSQEIAEMDYRSGMHSAHREGFEEGLKTREAQLQAAEQRIAELEQKLRETGR